MKVHELMALLAHLNPEAEVYVYVGLSPGPSRLENIYSGTEDATLGGVKAALDDDLYEIAATPSDTLIVLSE